MIALTNIRPYIEKMAYLISKVLDMDVLICDEKLRIIGDFAHKGVVCEEQDIEALRESSVISKAILSREIVIYTNAKEDSEGCKQCENRDECRTESIIAYPLIEKGKTYGAIGIYSQETRQKEKLITQEKAMLEFFNIIKDLIFLKLQDEENKNQDIIKKANELIMPMKSGSFDEIIGTSKKLLRVKEDAKAFSSSSSNILIQGESGTGKEVFAYAIHRESKFSKGPFVAINCAAIPDNLLESELFGYEEGSFTGAVKGGRAGKFEIANNGTLFLDEIGELPIHLQPKILRAIQERKIQRVGAQGYKDVNIRIIAATNRNLSKMIESGEFREDLYYRLSVIPISIPPLRERIEDVPDLLEYFLNMYKEMLNRPSIMGFDDFSLRALEEYKWPGNVRELQNAVEYSVNRCKSQWISLDDLPDRVFEKHKTETGTPMALADLEREAILGAVAYYGSSKEGKMQAAKVLGISLATLYRKLNEYIN